MSNKDPRFRSFEPLGRSDLERLRALALEDRRAYFFDHPQWSELYAERILGIALCQGAALHYIDPTHGINDFDVYTFYASNPLKPWYAKRRRVVDFGDPKFGQSEVTNPQFVGRRVDLMGKGIDVPPNTPFLEAVRFYLATSKRTGALELAKKAIVILEPSAKLGLIAWPLGMENFVPGTVALC